VLFVVLGKIISLRRKFNLRNINKHKHKKTMKKTLLALLILSFGLPTFAKKKGSKNDFDNQFYFRGGLTRPMWKYGFAENKDDYEADGFTIKRKGGNFELGSIFFLNSIDFNDQMRIGINADYLNVSWATFQTEMDGVDGKYKNTTLFLGSKVGPSFTYSPVDKMFIDVYAKAHIVYFAPTVNYDTEGEDFDLDDASVALFKLRPSFGFNFRYSVGMIGFEMNPGRMKTRLADNIGDEEGEEFMQDEDGKNPRYNTFSITLGLSF